jgi:hypothetical protein
MRRILYYSLLCFLWVSVNSCSDDEASQPPPPTVSVDKTTGLLSDTEFTFKVTQVGSGSISLIPYGVENPSYGGVLIPSSAFENGEAKVKFTYGHVGTFQAVASATNHSGDGKSVKTSYSAPVTVTISSDKATMSDFSFDGSTGTVVTPDDGNDAADHDVTITIPWSKYADIGKLKLRYSASAESKVTVGGVAQESDKNEQDYSNGNVVTYTVTSLDGTKSRTYNVSVVQTPAEMNADFKSLSAIITNKGKLDPTNADYAKAQLKVATGRVLPSYIDNASKVIVIYDTLNVNPAVYDSLALDFALDGKFSNVKFNEDNWGKHDAGDRVRGKDTVSLKGADMPLELEVTPEDSVSVNASTPTPKKVYSVYLAEAPKLLVETTNLIPNRSGSSNDVFAVSLDAIGGTDLTDVDFAFDFDLPVGSTVTSLVVVQDNGDMPLVTGVGPFFAVGVDIKKPIKVLVTVDAPGSTPDFVVTYTVSVTVK